jgi:hypothetical protein
MVVKRWFYETICSFPFLRRDIPFPAVGARRVCTGWQVAKLSALPGAFPGNPWLKKKPLPNIDRGAVSVYVNPINMSAPPSIEAGVERSAAGDLACRYDTDLQLRDSTGLSPVSP